MPTKEYEYKAQAFQIAGFALMTPLGRIFLQPTTVFKEFNLFGFIIYLVFSFLIFLVGFIFIEQGRAILEEKRKLQ